MHCNERANKTQEALFQVVMPAAVESTRLKCTRIWNKHLYVGWLEGKSFLQRPTEHKRASYVKSGRKLQVQRLWGERNLVCLKEPKGKKRGGAEEKN